MAIIDAITFHNEFDLWDIRYNMYKGIVDEFVVVESTTTFGGLKKELYFPKDKYPDVRYYVNEDKYIEEEIQQARESINTGGVDRWMWEFLQKESIQKALIHLKDDDTVFVGDVDEYWDINQLDEMKSWDDIWKLKLRVYAYYLNMRSNEEFWGTIVGKYKDIKGKCLNHLRVADEQNKTEGYYGWHFTNQGGLEAVKQKVFDQYNPDVFGDSTWYRLPIRFGEIDYLGRDFKLEVDESELPAYILNNKDQLKHLIK